MVKNHCTRSWTWPDAGELRSDHNDEPCSEAPIFLDFFSQFVYFRLGLRWCGGCRRFTSQFVFLVGVALPSYRKAASISARVRMVSSRRWYLCNCKLSLVVQSG